MNKKKVLLITAIATVVIICVYVFFVHNNTNNFRENNVIYFASFFSGIIVPILALLNILVFIDISKWLSVEDNNRAIRQFQLDEIKKINNLIDELFFQYIIFYFRVHSTKMYISYMDFY